MNKPFLKISTPIKAKVQKYFKYCILYSKSKKVLATGFFFDKSYQITMEEKMNK
jgi:hypothetical protein